MDEAVPDAQSLLRLRPELGTDPSVLSALALFDGQGEIPAEHDDVLSLMQGTNPIRTLTLEALSMCDAALALVDDHPEVIGSLGMLRCYLVPPDFLWDDLERAEDEMGNALTMDAYGWTPDAFTVKVREDGSPVYNLVVVYADG